MKQNNKDRLWKKFISESVIVTSDDKYFSCLKESLHFIFSVVRELLTGKYRECRLDNKDVFLKDIDKDFLMKETQRMVKYDIKEENFKFISTFKDLKVYLLGGQISLW